MAKLFFALLGVFVVLGGFAVFNVRERMSGARLGSDVTYTIDAKGDAGVEMANKSYFVDAETEKNFDAMAARIGTPDVEPYRKGVENSLKNITDKTGRVFVVDDFEGRFDRHPDYGAQLFRFRWFGFAEKRDSVWVVDFRAANSIKLTKDSSLTVVLPPGATLVKADPAPTTEDGTGKLVWEGPGEMPWPHIEYGLQ